MLRISTPRDRGYNFFHGMNPFAFHPPHHPPHVPPHHPPHGPPPHPHLHPNVQVYADLGHGFGPWGRGGYGRRGSRRCGRGKPRCHSGQNKCDRHAQTDSGEAPNESTDVPVGPPFLHAVGETIASFLGPLGVEVHTYASNETGTVCCIQGYLGK